MDLTPLIENAVKRGDLSSAEAEVVAAELASGLSPEMIPQELEKEPVASPVLGTAEDDKTLTDVRAQLLEMTIGQKIKLALLGNSVARSLLIFNPNKMIQDCVLRNPRLTEGEVHGYLKSTNISDHALRFIAGDKDLMKSYTSRINLVSNPKTPGDIGVKWIRFINQTDLKKLAKSKNVSHVIQTTARRMIAE